MGNYKDDFKKRNEGVKAEDIAYEFYKGKNLFPVKIGFDALNENIPAKMWLNTPRKIRNIPDFVVINKVENFFVECKGASEAVKFKIKDLKSYAYWSEYMAVIMFIYSTSVDSIYRIEYLKLMELIDGGNYRIGMYKENLEKFYEIPVKDLTLKGKSSIRRTG